jgi:hypothetical protein
MIIEAIKGMKELADTAGIKITELSLDTESFCRLDTEIQLSEEVKYFKRPNVHEPATVYGVRILCQEIIE